MDMWLYYDVTHADHIFCNPISAPKVDELGRVLELGPGKRVLDIACGHAECLVRWNEQHGIGGVGVDLSPYAMKRAEDRVRERAPHADLRLVEVDGAQFETEERFDVVMCIGASWIWNGYEGTLHALRGFAKPGGLLVSGEPYWKAEPVDAYLKAVSLEADQFHSLAGCREVAARQELQLVWMMDSSLDEWDRYEMDQAAAVDRFARREPDHPELDALPRRAPASHRLKR
ncbi:MAG: SAM-dependent methyltransferase [Planctomycetota bacterium]|jgi:SAM-dependent methyltransferase